MAASSGCRAGSASGRSEAHHRPRDRRQRNSDLAVDVRRWQRHGTRDDAVGLGGRVAGEGVGVGGRQSSCGDRAPSGRMSTVSCTGASGERLTTKSTAPASSWVATASTSRHLAVRAVLVRSATSIRRRRTSPAASRRGERERVEGRLPPGRAAGLGHDRRDDVDELRQAGDA